MVARVLGLTDTGRLLAWYDAIVAGVSALTEAGPAAAVPGPAAAAFGALRASLAAAAGASPLAAASAGLSSDEFVSNAAVLLFGGIETTEGMIANAAWHLLTHAGRAGRGPGGPVPAGRGRRRVGAAGAGRRRGRPVCHRRCGLGGAAIRAGDLVIVSLAGGQPRPGGLPRPGPLRPDRPNARQGLAFALGPHFCIGAQLARLETEAALGALLDRLPGLRLDAGPPPRPGWSSASPPSCTSGGTRQDETVRVVVMSDTHAPRRWRTCPPAVAAGCAAPT